MSQVRIGIVPINRGVYSSSLTYMLENEVYDKEGGDIYVSLADNNTGNPLTDTTKWGRKTCKESADAADTATSAANKAAAVANAAATNATNAVSNASTAIANINNATTAAQAVVDEYDDTIEHTEDNIVVNAFGDDSEVPQLCGQPMILFGTDTPQESIVPMNWKQYDPATDEGYNWNGEPCAPGQQYININAETGGRYIACPKAEGSVELVWKNF